jgi:hypothetical protein
MPTLDQKGIEPEGALEVLRVWVEGELARSTHELSELLRSPIAQGSQEWLNSCLDTLDDIAAADTNLKILDRYM